MNAAHQPNRKPHGERRTRFALARRAIAQSHGGRRLCLRRALDGNLLPPVVPLAKAAAGAGAFLPRAGGCREQGISPLPPLQAASKRRRPILTPPMWRESAATSKPRSRRSGGDESSLTLAALASLSGLSAHSLERAFRRVTGITPRQYVDAHRMRRLKSRLKKGDDVTTALYDAGFGSSSRLYERAPQQLGMTPATYRRGGAGMEIHYTIAASPLGRVLVAATDRGVSAVYLGENDAKLESELRREYPNAQISRDRHGLENWVGQDRRTSERPRPESRFAHGRAGHRVSAPRMGRAAQDSVWHHAHLHASGTRHRQAVRSARGRSRLRHESGLDRSAMPPRSSRRRKSGRLSLGPIAQTSPDRARSKSAGRAPLAFK